MARPEHLNEDGSFKTRGSGSSSERLGEGSGDPHFRGPTAGRGDGKPDHGVYMKQFSDMRGTPRSSDFPHGYSMTVGGKTVSALPMDRDEFNAHHEALASGTTDTQVQKARNDYFNALTAARKSGSPKPTWNLPGVTLDHMGTSADPTTKGATPPARKEAEAPKGATPPARKEPEYDWSSAGKADPFASKADPWSTPSSKTSGSPANRGSNPARSFGSRAGHFLRGLADKVDKS
jgi:hypothetical protein